MYAKNGGSASDRKHKVLEEDYATLRNSIRQGQHTHGERRVPYMIADGSKLDLLQQHTVSDDGVILSVLCRVDKA